MGMILKLIGLVVVAGIALFIWNKIKPFMGTAETNTAVQSDSGKDKTATVPAKTIMSDKDGSNAGTALDLKLNDLSDKINDSINKSLPSLPNLLFSNTLPLLNNIIQTSNKPK